MGFIIYDSQAASFSHTGWSLVHFRWDLCTHYKDPLFFPGGLTCYEPTWFIGRVLSPSVCPA